jgi:hypothetical protein
MSPTRTVPEFTPMPIFNEGQPRAAKRALSGSTSGSSRQCRE